MDPVEQLRLGPAPRIGLVGAGGKSGLMFGLAVTYRRRGQSSVLSTSTHLGVEQSQVADQHLIVTGNLPETDLAYGQEPQIILVTGPPEQENRLGGLVGATLGEVLAFADRHELPLLVEADGARRLPLKAPDLHEPALPDFVDTVLVVAGLSGLGKKLGPAHVHRPERFGQLSGLAAGDMVTATALSQVLNHPSGGLKGIPGEARKVLVLNQASNTERKSWAFEIGRGSLTNFAAVAILETGDEPERPPRIHAVLEPLAGIVLAAGGSTRYARGPKQLLDWKGKPVVQVVAETAMRAGLAPVIVVAGNHFQEVQGALAGLPVEVVHNKQWASGMSTSVRAGLQALGPEAQGAMFLLGDQPQIGSTLVSRLMELHARERAAIIAPLVDGERGNPALFDRVTFEDLKALEGDRGGRGLFARYTVKWLEWHDARMLKDIDTEEDYRQLLASE